MSKYTTIENDIYFLNDKNITQDLHSECNAGFNSIPSLSLLQETAKILSGMTNSTSVDVEDQISTVSSFISGEVEQLSNYVKGLDVDVKLYDNQELTSASKYISVLTHLKQDDGQISISAIQLLSSHVNGLEEFVCAAIESLDVTEKSELNKFIRKISETDGKISVEFDKVTSSDIDGQFTQSQIEDLVDWRNSVETSALTLSTHLDSKLVEAKTNLSTDYIQKINAKAVELSTYSDKYTDDSVLALSNSISATANSKFAKYNDFDFSFDETTKYISLTLKNEDGTPSEVKKIDATAFITSGIINNTEIVDGILKIYWKTADGHTDCSEIPLSAFTEVYDAGNGLKITQTGDGFTFEINESIVAKVADLDSAKSRISTNETNIATLTSKQSEILQYTTKLSSDGGIINTLSSNIDDLHEHNDDQDETIESNTSRILELENYTNTLKGPTGEISVIKADIDAIEKSIVKQVSYENVINLNYTDITKYPLSTLYDLFKGESLAPFGVIPNGGLYEVVFNDLSNTTDDYSEAKVTLLDGTTLAHKDVILIHRDGTLEKTINIETLSSTDVCVLESVRFFEHYELSATVRDNYPWLSGGNKLGTLTVDNHVYTFGHAISGDNDYLGMHRFEQISAEYLSATNLSAANLSATNLSANDIDVTTLSADKLSATTLSVENGSTTYLSVASLSATNLSATNLSATNLSAKNADITDLSIVNTLSASFLSIINTDESKYNSLQKFITDTELSIDTLSNDLDHKIFANGVPLIHTALSIEHINQNDYHELVVANNCLSNTLYVVSGDYLNMYGQQIKNLAEPTISTDATTKKYVDNISSFLNEKINSEIENRIDADKSLCVELSTVLSTYTDTSVEALSDALSNEIDDLCVELSTVLSIYTDTSVKALSNALSGEIDELSNTYIKQNVMSNIYSTLSLAIDAQLSDVITKFNSLLNVLSSL